MSLPHWLSVWIVVVLVFPRKCAILCPTIERGSTIASMKMDGRGSIVFVDKSHNCLSSLGHMKRRSRSSSIVTDVGCGA